MKTDDSIERPEGTDEVEIFTPYITLRNGKRLWAKDVGLKAFRFFGKPREKTTNKKK